MYNNIMNRARRGALALGFLNQGRQNIRHVRRADYDRLHQLAPNIPFEMNRTSFASGLARWQRRGRRIVGKRDVNFRTSPFNNNYGGDQNPYTWFRNLLWRRRGHIVRASYRSNNGNEREIVYAGPDGNGIPTNPADFQQWVRERQPERDFMDNSWWIWEPDLVFDDDGDTTVDGRFKMMTDTHLTTDLEFQYFADGGGCFTTPIKEWASKKLFEASEKQIKRYSKIIDYCNKIENECGSVPECLLKQFAQRCRLKFIIFPPFSKHIKEAHIISHKKPIKVFRMTNSRFDHVDYNLQEPTIHKIKNNIEMMKLYNSFVDDINKNGEKVLPITYKTYSHQICEITRGNDTYEIEKDETGSQTITDFTKDIIQKHLYQPISVKRNPYLSKYLKDSCRYLGTIDFNLQNKETVYNFTQLPFSDLKHIDMKKCYTQYKQTKFYEGFVGKFHEMRKCNKIMGLGIYTIKNIKCTTKYAKWLKDELKIFGEYVSYTSPFLKCLKSFGVTFDIIAGAWGSKIDFEFTEEMLNQKNFANVPLYSYFCGRADNQRLFRKFNMYGNWQHHLSLQKVHNKIKGNRSYFTSDHTHNGKGHYLSKMNDARHQSGFQSFILGYAGCNILHQLSKIYELNLLRICGDGIYYNGDKIPDNKLVGSFRNKEGVKFGNEAGKWYFSGVHDEFIFEEDEMPIPDINMGKCLISENENPKNIKDWLKNHKNTDQPIAVVTSGLFKIKYQKKYINLANNKLGFKIIEINDDDYYLQKYNFGNERDCYEGIEVHNGPPGCGKTTTLCNAKGFINTAFISNGWYLVQNKCNKYGLKDEVFYILKEEGKPLPREDRLITFFRDTNVIIADEATMLDNKKRDRLIQLSKENNIKLLFCGDWDKRGWAYQCNLINPAMTIKDFHIKDYIYIKGKCRYTDQEFNEGRLIPLIYKLRKMIANCEMNCIKDGDRCYNCKREAKKYLLEYDFKIIKRDELKSINEKDRIIAPTNNICDNIYTKKMKTDTINRYKVKSKINGYFNGSVIWGTDEKIRELLYGAKRRTKKLRDLSKNAIIKYADTVHSLQGITAEEKIYIDIVNMGLREMYVSVSRPKSKEDIILVTT